MSRQEAVSMIPPLMLDVQPHHMVSSFALCQLLVVAVTRAQRDLLLVFVA